MKTFLKCLLLLGFMLPGPGHAQIEQDHLLHFGAGMVAGGAGALVASELSHGSRFWTFAGAVGASVLAGVAKEAIDAGNENNHWDNRDLGATALGGLTVGVVIDLFTAGKRRRGRVAYTLPANRNLARGRLRLPPPPGEAYCSLHFLHHPLVP